MENQIKVEGMSCQHCVQTVIKELQKIGATQFNVEIGNVNIDPELNGIDKKKIIDSIQAAGYKVVYEENS